LALAISLVLIAGCKSRLNQTFTFTLDSDQDKTYEIDGPAHDQKVTITVTADSIVSLYVYLDSDRESVQTSLERAREPTKLLGKKMHSRSANIVVTVPAHNKFWVTLTCEERGKTIPVTLNIRGD